VDVLLKRICRRILLAGLVVSTGPRAIAQIPESGSPVTPLTLSVEISVYLDSIARSAGIPILRQDPGSPGVREIRMWVHGWYLNSGTLFRIVNDHGRIRGEMIFHWPDEPSSDPDERPGLTWYDAVLYSLQGKCDRFTRSFGVGTCRPLFISPPNWMNVLHAAEARGLWTLPDESHLPKDPFFVLDGWGMIVELRDGHRYRAYQHSNPNHHPSRPESMQASALADVFRPLESTVRRSNNERLYRGLYVGAQNKSEFTVCGSSEPWYLRGNFGALLPTGGFTKTDGAAPDTVRRYVEASGMLAHPWAVSKSHLPYKKILEVDSVLVARPWTVDACGS